MRIYKIAFRNDMDVATNILSKKVFTLVKGLYESGQLFSKKHRKFVSEMRYPGMEEAIDSEINVDIEDYDFLGGVVVEADFNPNSVINLMESVSIIHGRKPKLTNKKIRLFINISPTFSSKFYHFLYMEVVEAIRHELTHFQQRFFIEPPERDYDLDYLNKEKNPVKRFTEIRKYLMDAGEQEPFIRGLMLACKKQKKPIMPAIKEYIHASLFTNDKYIEKLIRDTYGLEADHAETLLIDLYMKRVKEIFPDAEI